MKKNEENQSALDHVDSHRRDFLSKLLAGGAAAAAIPVMSTVAFGEDEEGGRGKGKGGKGKGGKGKGGKGKGGKGKGGKGKGGEGKGKGGENGRRPSPNQLATRMIKKHDKDGDGALNAKELTDALTEMFQRRQANQGGGSGKGKGKGDGSGKGKGKGKGKGSNSGDRGGVKPKRPASN